jgi:hypothetical protein
MREELDKKLCKKYPKLYAQRGWSMQETCMCWGFPGDGWYDLIDRLSAKIEPLGAVASQVKEKFGTLRFYIGGVDNENFDEVYQYINEAERESAKTCERCGDTETACTRGGFWLQTLCNVCEDKRKKEHEKSRAVV